MPHAFTTCPPNRGKATMELAATGNVAAVFQVMSNELGSLKVLICPADTTAWYATNFSVNFGPTNISYFVGLDAATNFPYAILAGDDNFEINGKTVNSGVLALSTNTPIAWSAARHHLRGNIFLADGSVWTVTDCSLTNAIINQYGGPSGFTNRFRIAIP